MDVASWMRDLGLERYEAAFRENDIRGEDGCHLTAEDLEGGSELPRSAIDVGRWLAIAALKTLQSVMPFDCRPARPSVRWAISAQRRPPPNARQSSGKRGRD